MFDIIQIEYLIQTSVNRCVQCIKLNKRGSRISAGEEKKRNW